MEDGFISQKVDHKKIVALFNLGIKNDCEFLTILKEPHCHDHAFSDFGRISKDSAYRATATCALWNKRILKKLLVPAESAWEFEKKGARRTERYDNFFSCYEDQVSLVHMVIKGKFVRGSVETINALGVNINSNRDTISFANTIYGCFYSGIRKLIFRVVPLRFHKSLIRKS